MADFIRIQWRNWRAPTGRFASEAPQQLHAALRRAREAGVAAIRREAPEGHSGAPGAHPGALRRGIEGTLAESGAAGVVGFRSTAPHTAWVLHGRGPIVARGRALHFWIDGREFFRKRVGPAQANPFMDRAAPEVARIMDAETSRVLGAFRTLLLESD